MTSAPESPQDRGADAPLFRGSRALWLCFGFALLVRVAFVVARRTWHGAEYWDFAAIAESLLRHQGYSGLPGWYWFTKSAPTAFQAPLYTLFTAACYGLFGLRTDAAHLVMQSVQCVVSALCVFPVAALGAHLHSRRAGLIAAAGLAVYPASIFLSAKLSASTWATLLLLWILLETLRLARRPSLRRSLLLGGLWGVMLLTYPTPAVFGLPSGAWLLLAARPGERGRVAARAGIALGVALLICSPWAIRNYLVFHRPVPTITSFGPNLFMGNNEYATGSQENFEYFAMIRDPRFLATYPWLAPENVSNDEVGLTDRMFHTAIEFIRRHPGRAGALFLHKLVLFSWSDPMHPGHGSRDESIYLASYLLLLLVGALGMAQSACFTSLLRAGGSELALVLLLILSVSCLHALTSVGQVRYRMILEPVLIPYAGIAVTAAWTALRGRARHVAPAS